jgi:hypothetical protein
MDDNISVTLAKLLDDLAAVEPKEPLHLYLNGGRALILNYG